MSEISACRACLAVEVKMHTMLYTNLSEYYLNVTGIDIQSEDGRPHYICFECHRFLIKYLKFKEQCLKSEQLLTEFQNEQMNLTNLKENIIKKHRHKASILEYSDLIQHNYNPEGEGIEFRVYKTEIKEDTEVFEEATPSFDDAASCDSDDVPLKEIIVKKELNENEKNREVIRNKVKKKRGFHEDYATEVHLSREQQLEDMTQRSKSDNYISCPYKCQLCFKGFIDNTAFVKHLVRHDQKTGKFECDLCHMRYPYLRQLRTHLSTSHARHFACKKCAHTSHTANQAREHERWHRGFLYECKLCGETFRKPTSHLTHLRKRHPTEFVCELCGDSFVGRHGLLMHKTKAHSLVEAKPAQDNAESHCTDCGVQFISIEAWKRHIVTSLRHTKDVRCKICNLEVGTSSDMVIHYKIHLKELKSKFSFDKATVNVATVPCKECDSNFLNRSKLQAHVKRKHLGLKYNKHIVCEVCGKKCTSNATLKYHQRTHTGEKPYSCTECPKRFSDNNQLKIHNRTHTDERPYSCSVCSKTFRQKPALNRHYRVHTGVKPYECHYCTKQFTQSNSLKLHIRTVHLKLPANRRKNQIQEKTTVLQCL